MIDEVIARKKVYPEGDFNSKLVEIFSGGFEGETIAQLRDRLSDRLIVNTLFGEEIDTQKWEDSALYREYNRILQTGHENELFCKLYKVSRNFAVSIEAHTYLCFVISITNANRNNEEELFPWYIICGKEDISDTWWESNKEILDDMTHLSFIQYVEKYRMYR